MDGGGRAGGAGGPRPRSGVPPVRSGGARDRPGVTGGGAPPGRRGPAGSLARWVDEVVIGRGLCPFAEPARARTRFVELTPPTSALASNVEDAAASIRAELVKELGLLAREPQSLPATTIAALPQVPAFAFEQFMNLVVLPMQELAEEGRNELGESLKAKSSGGCGIQCVPFHPEAEYGEGNEAEEWATRAPVPAVHLLRDCDVEAAELQWQMAGLDPADIHLNNVKRLRELGAERAAAMVRDCAETGPFVAETVVAPEAADVERTGAAARALLSEATAAGVDASKLVLHRVGTSGWGAVASRDLQWDEAVLSLPRAALRTPADAKSAGLRGTGHPAGDLAALLLHERSLGRASALRAYVSMLPSLELLRAQHPLMASEAELVFVLGQETLVGREAVARRREALTIAGVVRATLISRPPPRECDILWALSIVSSRAFYLDLPGEGPSLCLCPVADMLNHSEAASAQQRARLQWEPGEGAAVVRAYRDFAPGEEVFDSFGGGLSVSDSFLRYGFAQGVGTEKVTVPLGRLTPCRTNAGRAILSATGLEHAEVVFTAQGPDEVGLGCLVAAEATEEELRSAGWGKGGGGGQELLALIYASLEEPWAQQLADRTWARLAGALHDIKEQYCGLDGGNTDAVRLWEAEARMTLECEERVLCGAVAAAAARAGASLGVGTPGSNIE